MAFENNLGGIRAFGRRMILPAEEMKNLIKTELLDKYPIRKVIDFGAGTLYWSDWFQEQFSGTGGVKCTLWILYSKKMCRIRRCSVTRP